MDLWFGSDIHNRHDAFFGMYCGKPIVIKVKLADRKAPEPSCDIFLECCHSLLDIHTLKANDLLDLLEECAKLYCEIDCTPYPGLGMIRSLKNETFSLPEYYIGLKAAESEDFCMVSTTTWHFFDVYLRPNCPVAVPTSPTISAVSDEAFTAAHAAKMYFINLAGSYDDFVSNGP